MSGAVGDRLSDPGTGAVGYPVVIIDDHELFGTSLTMALRSKGFDARVLPVAHVPGFLGGGAGPTGLVVLDLDLGQDPSGHRVDGTDLVAGLQAREWKVLVVTGSLDESRIAAAIAAGAIGSVPKWRPFEALLRTVAAAAGGQPVMTRTEHQEWLERHRHHLAKEREVARRLARLSPREREVLELLAEGMRAAAIAAHFVVSMPTVRTQIRSILSKLQVGSQLEAVALLRQEHIPGTRS